MGHASCPCSRSPKLSNLSECAPVRSSKTISHRNDAACPAFKNSNSIKYMRRSGDSKINESENYAVVRFSPRSNNSSRQAPCAPASCLQKSATHGRMWRAARSSFQKIQDQTPCAVFLESKWDGHASMPRSSSRLVQTNTRHQHVHPHLFSLPKRRGPSSWCVCFLPPTNTLKSCVLRVLRKIIEDPQYGGSLG